jgi:hypothetical protein
MPNVQIVNDRLRQFQDLNVEDNIYILVYNPSLAEPMIDSFEAKFGTKSSQTTVFTLWTQTDYQTVELGRFKALLCRQDDITHLLDTPPGYPGPLDKFL